MNKVVNYCKDVYNELVNKTTWPAWNELFSSARVVMIASLIIALVILAMDLIFEYLLKGIYSVL
ncbi:MAG: preprotein translocase subunit SecE [Bacteroidales bacterium]|nr:preprotein translocase subunit SecE [Bacteroidales bacterium]MDD7698254.1 preprotein translocase subunit SecE [Spirochaetia bacterium]MDY4173932.1 preprotein translocase subunit SecE [Bacteroidales bacterium]